MSLDLAADLTAELAALAADVQTRGAELTARIRAACPDGHVVNEFVGYLTLAAVELGIAADAVRTDGLHIDPGPTDLDPADPDVDRLLAELANA